MTNHPLRALRLAFLAAGLTVAAPSFASVLTPLCGGEKDDKHEDKTKSENKKEKEQPKKPTSPA
jgi:hypothetical protein